MRHLLLLPIAAALLAGCAGFSADGGFSAVQSTVKQHSGRELQLSRSEADQQRIDARVRELLARPLSADDAVQVALLNHRGLQAALAELGIAEADLVQAGRMPNPGFTFSRISGAGEVHVERGLHFGLARLIAMPWLRELQAQRFAAAQGATALQALQHAGEARKAWVQAVAAAETERYAGKVMQAAEASAELARRMAQVGNFNKLQQAREQAFYADAALSLARAAQARLAARERLIRWLGLWGEQVRFELPERLPDLPATPRELPDAEQTAIAQRLDVQGARLLVEQSAREFDLVRGSRFIGGLTGVTLGPKSESATGEHSKRGWEIGIELPLFDRGDARLAKAAALHRQAGHRAAAIAIDARSEVREAFGAYRTAWDIARHQRDEVVPLAQRISEENLLRYNGMLIGVFELLADARAQVTSVVGAIGALRDFWLAQADLDMALIGKPSLMAAPLPTAAAAATAAAH